MAAVCNGRRSVGEFGECWRQTVVIERTDRTKSMRALACWGWLASNRTALNTSPRPTSTRFRNSCASGVSLDRLPALSEFEPSSAPSESCGQRANPKPILNRSQKSGESLATSQLVQHYRQRARLDEGIDFQYVAKATQACRKLTMELAVSSTSLFTKDAK